MINTQLSYEAAAHSSYSQFTSNIMASSPVVTTGGSVLVVVTHVIPAPQVAAAQNTARKNKLRRGHVVALGTAQIMIGLMVFLFEFTMIPCTDTLGIVSGVFVWRPLCSVLSGSLTVAAEEFNNCAVKGALGFIVVSVVTSAGATVIYGLDAFDVIWNFPFNHCYSSYYNRDIYWIRTTAVSGVLAGVSVLEFIISICVFVFVYDASRQSMDQQPTVITNQSHEATTQTLTLPTYEPPPVSQPPTTIPERSYETMRPLEYDMSIPTPPPDPASFVAFKLF